MRHAVVSVLLSGLRGQICYVKSTCWLAGGGHVFRAELWAQQDIGLENSYSGLIPV